MAKRALRVLILLISVYLALVPLVAADTGGYVVETIPPDKISGISHDPGEISFWQLSPRVMAIAVALSVFPVLVFPVELIFTLKTFAVLGYRRIEKTAILYNENRRVIFEAIRSNPGIYFNELCRITDINRGTLKHHLMVLELNGRITTLRTSGPVWYFENNGYYNRLEKTVLHYLREPVTRKSLEIVSSHPRITQKELAESLGISEPSVSRHMKVLEEEKIVRTQKSGRYVQYELTGDSLRILQIYLRNASGVASA
jgi:predicted transcriptional regulator